MTILSAARLRVWFRMDALVFGQDAPTGKLLQDIADNFNQSATKLQAKTPHTHIGTIQRLQVPFPVPFTRVSLSCQMDTLWPGDEVRADDLVRHEQYRFAHQVLCMLEKKHPQAAVSILVRNDNSADLSDAGVLTLGFQADDLLTFRQSEIKAVDERASFWHRFWDNEDCESGMWASFQQWRPNQFQAFLAKLQHTQLDSVLAPKAPAGAGPRF